MAQAELNITIDKMSGKIYGESDVYITHRNGKTVISHYPKHRDPNSLTPHQRELNTSFAQLSKQAKVELTDPEKRAAWQQRYDEYKANYMIECGVGVSLKQSYQIKRIDTDYFEE